MDRSEPVSVRAQAASVHRMRPACIGCNTNASKGRPDVASTRSRASYPRKCPHNVRNQGFDLPVLRWAHADRDADAGWGHQPSSSKVYRVMSLGNVVQAKAFAGRSSHRPPCDQCSVLASYSGLYFA
jgi:hypothetical protein